MRQTQSPGPGVSGPPPSRSERRIQRRANGARRIPEPMAPRRRLRAVFAADIANFGGLVSIDETRTLDALLITRRLAIDELAAHGGWLFGLPGDGIFALFESTVDAVRCALRVQSRLAESPKLYALKLRIGVHLGEVLFQDELPCGETLVIASRLESLAAPGGVLVSASVMEAVASHVAATFTDSGVPTLKHSSRRIETYRVLAPPPRSEASPAADLLDRTVAPIPAPRREFTPPTEPGDVLAIPRLPKAAPLIMPAETPAMVETPPINAPPSIAPVASRADIAPPPPDELAAETKPTNAAATLDRASLDQLAHLLAVHLGPVAGLLVRREAAENPDAGRLIRTLAQEIPNDEERRSFVTRAKAILAGPH